MGHPLPRAVPRTAPNQPDACAVRDRPEHPGPRRARGRRAAPVATAPLSDLYHAAGATPQDQATLVLVWHGIHAMFDALLFTGLAIVPLGLIPLGAAMLRAPGYGKPMGAGRPSRSARPRWQRPPPSWSAAPPSWPPWACSPSSASTSRWAGERTDWPGRPVRRCSPAHDRHRLGARDPRPPRRRQRQAQPPATPAGPRRALRQTTKESHHESVTAPQDRVPTRDATGRT